MHTTATGGGSERVPTLGVETQRQASGPPPAALGRAVPSSTALLWLSVSTRPFSGPVPKFPIAVLKLLSKYSHYPGLSCLSFWVHSSAVNN